jgi:multicomponent Na+:H+ antiporter subunit D
MAIPLFSLVGIPPLSGFWAKIFLIQAGLETKDFFLIGFIVLGSFLTLWVIARLWGEVFWKNGVGLPKKANGLYFGQMAKIDQWMMVFPIFFLSVISLYIGFSAENIIILSQKISSELMNPTGYIEAVLGLKTVTP